MTTKEFVAMQLAKPFTERRIPDSSFIRNYTHPRTLVDLIQGEEPENGGFCFDNYFMYEHYNRYLGSFTYLYPNVVITEQECREHS